MEDVVEKFVAKPKEKHRDEELQKIQQVIDVTLQQIYAVEHNEDNIVFANEAQAVEIKRKQLRLLQKRKEAMDTSDKVASKKLRKIDLNFLKKTKKQHVNGKLGNKLVEFTIRTPFFSFHKLSAYSSKYTFETCEIRVDFTGPKVTRLDINSLHDNHPMVEKISAIYNTEAIPANLIRYALAIVLDREVIIRLKDNFSGLIPTEVKKDIIEAEEIFDEIFLVKEANWQVDLIEKDPLIIGILDGEAYLVAHFDCTPFEHYAKSEF